MPIDGKAIVYCEGAFGHSWGKTAHGLVRRTRRYDVVAVVDSRKAGQDAGEVLDGRPNGIPLLASVQEAVAHFPGASHFVIGLAPDGGRLDIAGRKAVAEAISRGLDVDSGLHDFLTEMPELVELARVHKVTLRDVRKVPPRSELHFFSGKIREVEALKIAVLGTDSGVGKRTTSWCLVDAFEARGISSELVGTGQTAWLQGARYGILLDSLVNDFVAGELEHAVWSAWKEARPRAIVIEGQGSLLHPAYPGGFEILAAARPDAIVLQHAPTRKEYDGFPGNPMHPLKLQIQALELISGKPVVAVAVNSEGIARDSIERACRELTEESGLPAKDVLVSGADWLVDALEALLPGRRGH